MLSCPQSDNSLLPEWYSPPPEWYSPALSDNPRSGVIFPLPWSDNPLPRSDNPPPPSDNPQPRSVISSAHRAAEHSVTDGFVRDAGKMTCFDWARQHVFDSTPVPSQCILSWNRGIWLITLSLQNVMDRLSHESLNDGKTCFISDMWIWSLGDFGIPRTLQFRWKRIVLLFCSNDFWVGACVLLMFGLYALGYHNYYLILNIAGSMAYERNCSFALLLDRLSSCSYSPSKWMFYIQIL